MLSDKIPVDELDDGCWLFLEDRRLDFLLVDGFVVDSAVALVVDLFRGLTFQFGDFEIDAIECEDFVFDVRFGTGCGDSLV
jgi:hypothetical protein